MVERMQEKGHLVLAYDPNKESVERARAVGIKAVDSLPELFPPSRTPRTVWIMVPHTAVDQVLDKIIPLLSPKDTIIDGGNSPYKETIRRAKKLGRKGIRMLDVGVSGGPAGARRGACLMVGGDPEVFDHYETLFQDLAVKQGSLYVGLQGAGHFTKMVHNGIEYGMMQAIAEGFDVLRNAPYEIPLTEVARLYDHGSVIESKLMGWLVSGFDAYGEDLAGITGSAAASGEGLWTVEAAQELEVPVKVIEHALKAREKAKGNRVFKDKSCRSCAISLADTRLHPNMLTIHTSPTPLEDAVYALNTALRDAAGKDVLLLLSGGSALALAAHLDPSLLSSHVTISMLDERYTTDPASSNFAQFAALSIYHTVHARGVQYLDTRPQPVESLDDTERRLDLAFKHWHITHHDGMVIATMGIGDDGHLAGILPFPEDAELFASLFLAEHRCIRGYQTTPNKNPHPKRLTTTLSYLKKHVAHAIVYAVGGAKRTALLALSGTAPIEHVPVRILGTLSHVQIYTDLTLTPPSNIHAHE